MGVVKDFWRFVITPEKVKREVAPPPKRKKLTVKRLCKKFKEGKWREGEGAVVQTLPACRKKLKEAGFKLIYESPSKIVVEYEDIKKLCKVCGYD